MDGARAKSRIAVAAFIAVVVFMFGLAIIPSLASEAHAASLAAGSAHKADGASSLQTQAVKKYDIWVGGKRVTSKNAKNILGNGTASYNAKTNTLTLRNARINKAYVARSANGYTFRYGIYSRQSGKGLTILLKGANKISVPGTGTSASYGISIANPSGDPENLSIKGTGSLRAHAGKAGLFSFGILCQNLNIRGSVKVTAQGGANVKTSAKAASSVSSAIGSYGVYALGFLALGGSSKLTASGKTKALNKAATYAQGYTPQVKAGASSKKISLNKRNPPSSVYTKYKYVSIAKAPKATLKKPAQLKITSVKAISGGFVASWKKVTKNCKGYQFQFSASKAFNKKKATVYTYSTTNTSYDAFRVNSLARNKVYYLHVRGFNKSGSKTAYGKWSTVRSVRTK